MALRRGIGHGALSLGTPPPPPPPLSGGEQPAPAAVGGPSTPTVRTRWPLGTSPVNDVVTSYGTRSAIYYGDVHCNGSNTTVWFEWGTDPTLTAFSATPVRSMSSATFTSLRRHWYWHGTGALQPNTDYYVRIAANNQHGTSKGAIIHFRTKGSHIPSHGYPRRPHVRMAQIDHRLVLNRSFPSFPKYWGDGVLTQPIIDDENWFYATNYDLYTNGKIAAKNINNQLLTAPYLTQFWFVPVGNQPSFEAAVLALGETDIENVYLHYPAGVNVAEYTHGVRVDANGVPTGQIAGGGDGTFFAAHVADGSKTRQNRVWGEQFKIQGYHYINFNSTFFQQWRTNLINGLMSTNANGHSHNYLWLDSHGIGVVQQYVPAAILEYPAGRGNGATPAPGTYWAAHHAFLAQERTRVNNGRIIINQSSRFDDAPELEFAKVPGGTMTEFMNGCYRSNSGWDGVLASLANNTLVEYNCAQDQQADSLILNTKGGITPGNYHTPEDRQLMFQYGSYHLTRDPNRMELLFLEPNIETTELPLFIVWCKAWERDIGAPLGPRQSIGNNGFTREFENARLYIRLGAGSIPDSTAVNIALPSTHNWHLLHADGTIDPAITTLTLRRGEAVILLKG